jgi:hypothetical protein
MEPVTCVPAYFTTCTLLLIKHLRGLCLCIPISEISEIGREQQVLFHHEKLREKTVGKWHILSIVSAEKQREKAVGKWHILPIVSAEKQREKAVGKWHILPIVSAEKNQIMHLLNCPLPV